MAVALVLATAFGQNPAPQSLQTQPPNEDVTIRINVNLVQVDAVVTDSKGKPVNNLEAQDFEILQDGKPQVITNFGYITTRPAGVRTVPVAAPKPGPGAAPPPPAPKLKPNQVRRTVALVVDDLGLSFESMARTRSAIKKWVDEQMQPGDMVAIVRTGAGMGALQQFTAEKRMLYAAIERCRYNPFGRTSIGTFAMMGDELSAEGRMDEFRETQFSVGTLGAITYVIGGLRELPGRKSILLFSEHMRMFNSEGSNQQVMERMRSLTDAANRASVVIYTIDPRGLETLSLSAADNVSGMSQEQMNNRQSRRLQENWESKDGLAFLAQETGGLFLDNNNDIYGGVKQVMEDQEGYYLIGYHPDASTFDEKKGLRPYHSVRVRVKRAGLKVRSRNGFYGVSDQEVRPRVGRSRDEQLAHALVSPFGSAEIGLRLTTLYSHIPKDSLKPVAKAARDAGFELEKARSAKKDRKTIREATEKYARLTAMSKTENYINSLLHIQASDLKFVDEDAAGQDPWKKAVIDILAINFGDNGQEIDRSNTTYTIRVKGDTYKDVLANGFIYSHRHPIRKPGAYQLRVALRDATSQKLGSATQFIEIPDINKGRLTLSGLVLKGEILQPKPAAPKPAAPGAAPAPPAAAPAAAPGYAAPSQMEGKVDAPDPRSSPAVRIFKPGKPLTYGYQVMNAQPGPNKTPQLEVQTRVFRDGKQVYEGKPLPFVADGQKDPRNLIAGGRLQLGVKMAPGDYVLQVIVVDKLAKDKYRTASQWMDFVVEP